MNSTLVVWGWGGEVNPRLHNKAFRLRRRSPLSHAPQERVDFTHCFRCHESLVVGMIYSPAAKQPLHRGSLWNQSHESTEAGGAKVIFRKTESRARNDRLRRASLHFFFNVRLLTAARELLCLKSAVIIYLVAASPTGETNHLPHQERKWLKWRTDLLFHHRSVTPALPKVSVSTSVSLTRTLVLDQIKSALDSKAQLKWL